MALQRHESKQRELLNRSHIRPLRLPTNGKVFDHQTRRPRSEMIIVRCTDPMYHRIGLKHRVGRELDPLVGYGE